MPILMPKMVVIDKALTASIVEATADAIAASDPDTAANFMVSKMLLLATVAASSLVERKDLRQHMIAVLDECLVYHDHARWRSGTGDRP